MIKKINKLDWNIEYAQNLADIEEQHKVFVSITNEIYNLSNKDYFTDDIALVKVARLVDYAFYHFFTEEDLFAKTNYDGALEHINSHNFFRGKTKKYLDLVRDKNTDKKALLKEVSEFSKGWLVNHISDLDRKFFEFFSENSGN